MLPQPTKNTVTYLFSFLLFLLVVNSHWRMLYFDTSNIVVKEKTLSTGAEEGNSVYVLKNISFTAGIIF